MTFGRPKDSAFHKFTNSVKNDAQSQGKDRLKTTAEDYRLDFNKTSDLVVNTAAFENADF